MGRGIRLSCCLALASAAIAAGFQFEKTIEVDRHYDAGYAKIELLGVCKATETKATCWDANGKPAPKLAEEFKETFEYGDYQHIPLKLGRKTRVAVFRVTRAPSADEQAGIDANFQTTGSTIQWVTQRQRHYNDPIQLKTVTFLAKPAEKEGQAIASMRYTFPKSEPLRVAEGESLLYQDMTYTVRKFGPTDSAPHHLAYAGNLKWVIAMTAEGKEKRPEAYWTAIGHDGLAIQAVDPNGEPVFAPGGPPYFQPGQVDASGKPVVPQKIAATINTGYGNVPIAGNDYILYTNIDPRKVKEIRARSVSSLRLTIKGIPLEPK